MEQIKIAAFDVDNTLFDYRNMCVPASTVAALNRLQEKGIRIVIASSRAYSELSEDLICRIHPDYYVGASGQSVQNANGSLLYAQRFTMEQTDAVVRAAEEYGLGLTLKYEDCTCIYTHPEEMWKVFSNIGAPKCPTVYCPSKDWHIKKLPLGFSFAGEQAACGKMREALETSCPDLRVEMYGNNVVADVFQKNFSKKSALAWLLSSLELSCKNIICFGDGTNDIEMIRWAGVGVAMGNACQSLKYIADRICPASWEDGIAHQLTSMGLA